MKTLLVTGGAGFIGSHTVVELLGAGYDVIVIDNCSNATPGSMKPVSLERVEKIAGKQMTYYDVDLQNFDSIAQVFKKHKIDCVLHFAAFKAVGESCQLPLEYYENNVGGTIKLAKAARDNGVRNFIFSSSATVYGVPEKLPLSEDHPVGHGVTNPYGMSKYFSELILRDLHKSDPTWNILLLRYFNPVGGHPSGLIGEDPKGTPNNLMPFVAQVAVGMLPCVKVFGNDYDTVDGTGVRDYIHVVDCAQGHVAALAKMFAGPPIGLRVYNLGTGQGYSVLQMISAMEKASGRKIAYEIVDRRPGDLATVYCDTRLAEADLGWKSKFGLDEMCRDLWNWQQKNPNGFRGPS